MPATRRRTRTRGPAEPPRMDLEYLDIHSIVPYRFNPRDNTEAIESVANSIRTFGFVVPVIVDVDNVLVAGHTRVEAAKLLQLTEVPAIRAAHLTEDQLNAFRLIDNKVASLSRWDFDLLSGEIAKLSDSGLVLTDFGWTRSELDCLSDMVQDDCLSAEGLVDLEAAERLRRAERRAPMTARVVIGEIVFFLTAEDYRTWVDGIRVLHDYDEAAIVADIKERLGMVEQRVEATVRVRRARGAE